MTLRFSDFTKKKNNKIKLINAQPFDEFGKFEENLTIQQFL